VRIEGLLAAFPKLMGSGKQGAGTVQHTFIETDAVRYVYQPLEGLYMLLLTNKSSNILEDLETLHLLAKLVSAILPRLFPLVRPLILTLSHVFIRFLSSAVASMKSK